ncbi:hypothetical protein JZ751_022348 [Albula glossodonta]|uniref:Uncharacterized protein n=1 Tax=Albula glossodonta TaxID=121402 RepID=A0A8T2NHF9_9TELE|nr:hypothetical protein JZ751_022348 [Albula glossodonta]
MSQAICSAMTWVVLCCAMLTSTRALIMSSIGVWPGSMACDFCTERKLRAVKSCLNCTASYCETHLRQHSSVPVRQRHTLVEATGNLEHRLCPQHHRALELFCNTDQMPICSLCPALTHRGHDVVCSEHGTQRVDEWIVQHHPTQASAGVPPPPGEIAFPTVGSDSVSLSWGSPEGMDTQSLRFRVTCISDTKQRSFKVTGVNHINIQSLSPGKEYTFTVATVGDKGTQSRSVSATVSTVIPAPVGLTVDLVTLTSVSLRWSELHGLDQTPSFLVSTCSPGTEPHVISTELHSTVLSNLQSSTQYTVSVCTVLENGEQSEAVSKTLYTGTLNICYGSETFLCLSWDRPPYMEGVPYTFRVTWGDSTGQRESITTDENLIVLSYLRPGTEYSISVCTELQSYSLKSRPVHTTVCTTTIPKNVNNLFVSTTSVCLSWDRNPYLEGVPHTFRVTWGDSTGQRESITTDENFTVLSHLRPGTEYSISVCAVLQSYSLKSRPVHTTVCTKPYPPESLRVEGVRSRSVRLCWNTPTDMEGVSYTFSITYTCYGEEPRELTTESNSNTADLCDLKPGMAYNFSICTVLHNGTRSTACSARASTRKYGYGVQDVATPTDVYKSATYRLILLYYVLSQSWITGLNTKCT